MKKELACDFLGELERAEARLLGWALVEGYFTKDELEDRAEAFIESVDAWNTFSSGRELIGELERLKLLFSWIVNGTEQRYRTRMAETVRLMAGLKQLFPKHLKRPGEWQNAPSLVSDFRFLNRPRQYPERNQDPAGWLPEWSAGSPGLSNLQEDAMAALLRGPDGGFFKLGGFQVRATTRILQEVRSESSSATMVCAGTGSGKTLAFYLPALTHLVGLIERDPSNWVRALAIYPRNELLKDQVSETISQARKINQVLRYSGLRPLRIGTLFGPTPNHAGDVAKKWAKDADGAHVCPFLVCPDSSCGGQFVWSEEDLKNERERVSCPKCGLTMEPDEIVLTRNRLMATPPDILFTTTEMMNQRMTDSGMWKLFGVGMPKEKKPAFLLLDEAHTYDGLHGAQVAYLLRRWLKRSGAKPHIVGLSATLMEAASFFSGLTGLPKGSVEEVSPEVGELKPRGMEYLLALRGDPVSGTSLLSTSIQTAMLLRKALDTNRNPVSEGIFGQKVFLFTDDLDATNRMFFNLRDAEGQNSWGRLDLARHPSGSLANLRSPTPLPGLGLDGLEHDEERRFIFGQSWRLASDIRHEFHQTIRVPIDRVSSQDSGVTEDSEVIVATASLEVGFNDPGVGAVIQHKAPRDPASFLQRKGRAGRRLEMRPWTVVVLSDFGRDRLAYQGYDLLFDPELRPRELPLENRHVQKMQAVYAFLDWLGIHLGQRNKGSVWSSIDLPPGSAYTSPSFQNADNQRASLRQRQKLLCGIITRILAGEDELQQLTDWLRNALAVSEEQVKSLLWEPPRALMTSVLPTLKRRLEHEWEQGQEYHKFWKPLPEFIPSSLFSGLNLPEVDVETFSSNADMHRGKSNVSAMRVDHALREFAPGRISRRFGVENNQSRHWIPLDPGGPDHQTVELDTILSEGRSESIGEFSYHDSSGTLQSIHTVRPYALNPSHEAPRHVRDSSNAFPIWHSQLLEPHDEDTGITIDLPSRSQWTPVIREIRFFTHGQFSPARVRRFTLGSEASILLDDGGVSEITADYADNENKPVALGFSFEADAVRIRIELPKDWKLSPGTSLYEEKIPALRSERFRWLVNNDPILQGLTNVFGRKWIAEISLSAIIANSILTESTPEEAWASIRSGESEVGFSNALEVLFQTIASEEDGDHTASETKRLEEIREFFDTPGILERLDEIVTVLWTPILESEWHPWLSERFLATLGAAFREAIQQICPNIDADSLLIDINPGSRTHDMDQPEAGIRDLWISETEPGGGGIIERFLPEIAENPRRFLDLATSALGSGDYEQADRELNRFLDLLCDPAHQSPQLVSAVKQVRNSQDLNDRIKHFEHLRALLVRSGFVASHVVIAALNSRLLKPGSTEQTDQRSWSFSRDWRAEEKRIGIEVDARSFAYASSDSDELDQSLVTGTLPLAKGQDPRNWRYNAIYGLLWPRGSQARNQALSLRNPFADIPVTERFLVLDALEPAAEPVSFPSDDWRGNFETILIENSRGRLSCAPGDLPEFKKALLSLLATPLDTGLLLVYPRLRGIERSPDHWIVDFELIAPGLDTDTDNELQSDESSQAQSRLIVKSAEGNREEVRDLLESILAVELLSPGNMLWLVSPWITDVPILDNRSGSYSGLDPSWPKRHLTLTELLGSLLTRNPHTKLSVVTRPNEFPSTSRFIERLRNIADLNGNGDQLTLNDTRDKLHTKGLVGDQVALSGSMNFTNNGISVLEETVQFQIDEQTVSDFLVSFNEQYESPQH